MVIASRGRPEYLRRCLTAVEQLIWPSFEVIVVADQAGRAVACSFDDVQIVPCETANLSLARNLGIAEAGGEVVAFVDDDAVPEPMWLAALASAFKDGSVGAATGPVLGRNGISPQTEAETILPNGQTEPARRDPSRRRALAGRYPKTVGTNMAFRADILRTAGGFDEVYRYYLEDSDLNLRLGDMGVLTAYEPHAVVHHATAKSALRRTDRAPISLHEIGRSAAVFVGRYAGDAAKDALETIRGQYVSRAERGLIAGQLEPRDVGRLLKSFDSGVEKAKTLSGAARLHQFPSAPEFRPRSRRAWNHVIIGCGVSRRKQARAAARTARREGSIVTLVELSRSTLYHHLRFVDGVWLQSGGAWGRSVRSDALIRFVARRARFDTEVARIAAQRGIFGQVDTQRSTEFNVSEARLSFF